MSRGGLRVVEAIGAGGPALGVVVRQSPTVLIVKKRGERGIEVNQRCGTTTDQCGGIGKKLEQDVGRW